MDVLLRFEGNCSPSLHGADVGCGTCGYSVREEALITQMGLWLAAVACREACALLAHVIIALAGIQTRDWRPDSASHGLPSDSEHAVRVSQQVTSARTAPARLPTARPAHPSGSVSPNHQLCHAKLLLT